MVNDSQFIDNSKDQGYCLVYIAHVFAAVFLTLLFVNLVGSRWAYYDIGINATSRGLTLILFIVPIIFVLLILGTAFSWYVLRHKSNNALFLGGLASMAVVFVLAFLFDLWRTIDYPNPLERNLFGYLHYYVTGWLQLFG